MPAPSSRRKSAARPATPNRHQIRHQKSHTKIVAKASRMMRERGLLGASVNEVMGAAGLTRGGFYAHFGDKSDMIAEAIAKAFEEAQENLFGSISEEGADWVAHAAARYLSRKHVDKPSSGCVATTIGAEVARSEATVKKAFQRGVEAMLAGIQEKSGGTRDEAVAFLSTCIGAVMLARAVHDDDLVEEIRLAAKRELGRRR